MQAPARYSLDLEGKTVLLTGATSGIGRVAAFVLAARGATLCVVARDVQKGRALEAELRASGNPRVELHIADLSRQADVRALAQAFRARHDRLDVLVNNAGAVFYQYQVSVDGYEMTFALNHLGYFLLTKLLLDLVAKTPGARIVSTSSDAHFAGRMRIDHVARREAKRDAGYAAYCDSKLANILFTRALARRLPAGVVANCFHPGLVATGFGHNNTTWLAKALKVIVPLVGRTPERGARSLLWLATRPEATAETGCYFYDERPRRPSALARDDALAERLWALSDACAPG